jgi:hypothetical protein
MHREWCAVATAATAATVARRLGAVTHCCSHIHQHRPMHATDNSSSEGDVDVTTRTRDVTGDATPVALATLKVGQVFSLRRTFTLADVVGGCTC